jgi:transposase
MPPKIPRKVKIDAISMTSGSDKLSHPKIATTLGISIKTIQRAVKKEKEHGDVEGGVQKRGPKGKMDFGMQNICRTLHY